MEVAGDVGARLFDHRVVRAEYARPELRHPTVVPVRLVPVTEFVGHSRQVVRDRHHYRICLAGPLARSVGVLEQPVRRRGIAGLLAQAGQLPHGGQQFPVPLGEIGPPECDRPLEHVTRPLGIPALGEGLGLLTGLRVRKRLRHPAMLHKDRYGRQSARDTGRDL
ncbi:hypothetical protein GCM10010168_50490 [Actinoplanes ianthinogenes]|uniref:Uncharacterized protein n=1 Tax=Actinoplanes ianthinogenes TaxID=122358 RepID=A0ABN6CM34_9ACTN|nr:hypothetical protein Aiant_67570 [Actinoplanes ianthinogenes]GGR26222.1 hypothetical protein GCM10010168_50490 [Actinoplanes ianthinogenes]